VFIERLNPGQAATGNDSAYYYPSPAVLVAGT